MLPNSEILTANARFQALMDRVATLEQTVAPLQAKVNELEETVEKYRDMLEFILSNEDFFSSLTVNLNPRLLNLESNAQKMTSQLPPITRAELGKLFHDHKTDVTNIVSAIFQSSTPHPSNNSPSRPKVAPPAVFSGKREDWKGFQSQLELFFVANETLYPNDHDRIVLAISRLGDTAAFKYMQRYVPSLKLPIEERPACISNLDQFFALMSKNFGVSNAHVLAETQLRQLKQRGSAIDYTNRFVNLAADTAWNDSAMISQFRLGLKESVQDAMANYPEPTTFAEFSQLAIDVDNRQYGYTLTRSGNKSSGAPSRSTTAHTSTTTHTLSTPATVSTPTTSAPTTTSMDMDLSHVRHGPLSPSERLRRQKEGLCTYCGSADHWLDDCPKKPAKPSFKNAPKATASISALQPTQTSDQPDTISFQLGKDSA